MATTIPTTGFEINRRIFQNVFIGLLLVMVGLGLGSALDSGRTSLSVEAAPAVVVAEHGAFTPLVVRDISGLAPRYAGRDISDLVVATEHGEFTAMAARDISGLPPRFAGSDIGSD